MAICLLIFFLRKDKFLICEIVFSGILILTNLIIIAMRIAIRDEDHVFLVICIWFGRALRVVVIYFWLDQYWFKINRLIFNRKIQHMKRNRTPVQSLKRVIHYVGGRHELIWEIALQGIENERLLKSESWKSLMNSIWADKVGKPKEGYEELE